MSSEVGSLELRSVSKVYDLASDGTSLRAALPRLRRPTPAEPLVALADVDLTVAPGEAVGIIGPNGAGKSTLLKVISGVTQPTQGSVRVGGRVGSMIELGLGFHPELTGWENLRTSGVMLGLSPSELARVTPAIAEFSGIADALSDPLKTYSAGMRARLGFAVATHVDADILAVDEVLSVGDADFQLRCIERIGSLCAAGTTLIFVSHDMSLVRTVCDRAVHLRVGRVVDDGPSATVVDGYLAPTPSRFRPARDPAARIVSCVLRDDVIQSGAGIEVDAVIEVFRPHAKLALSIELARQVDVTAAVLGTSLEMLDPVVDPGRFRVSGVSSPFHTTPGTMQAIVSLVDAATHERTDRVDLSFAIAGTARSGNMKVDVPPVVRFERLDGVDSVSQLPSVATARSGADGSAAAVSLRDVTKRYEHRGPSSSTLRRALPGRAGRPRRGVVDALAGLDLDIAPGTALGVIGPNGAGKTTLLRVIAGVTRPDAGSVAVNGLVAPMLDLGMGFHPDLTGWANLATSARLLQMAPELLAERLESIIRFADIGDAMDQPLKHFSTGMRARLGFALAVHAPADILLIDELLSVGDEAFRRKALEALIERQAEGATVVFVSHGLRLVEECCDRAVRIDRGRVVDDGPVADVVERYGGPSWAAGTADANSGIRIHSLRLERHHIEPGTDLVFEGLIDVDTPSPTTRLELTYRAPPPDRLVPLDALELDRLTFRRATIEPVGGSLAVAGTHRFHGSVSHNVVAGAMDLVIAAIDDRLQETVSEAWQSIVVGREREDKNREYLFDVDWEMEAIEEMEAKSG